MVDSPGIGGGRCEQSLRRSTARSSWCAYSALPWEDAVVLSVVDRGENGAWYEADCADMCDCASSGVVVVGGAASTSLHIDRAPAEGAARQASSGLGEIVSRDG